MRGRRTWWEERGAAGRLPRRVLLDRVRARREPADLLRRPRHPRRRPPEDGVRARRAARRRRPRLRRGYFRQGLDDGDRQVERYPSNDSNRMPLTRVPRAPVVGSPTTTAGSCPSGAALEGAGRARPALPPRHEDRGNPDWARTSRHALRRRPQEPAAPGAHARHRRRPRSRRLGLAPTVFHMNEGHSAFLPLERLRELAEEGGADHADAVEQLRGASVFTTHTPVPAGNEVFDPELVRRNVGALGSAAASRPEFAALGKGSPTTRCSGSRRSRCARRTTPTASRSSTARCRARCGRLWPDLPVDEMPIGRSQRRARSHLDLGRARGAARLHGAEIRARAGARRRGALGGPPRRQAAELEFIARTRGAGGLDPHVLTIGFARRFATYKRAALLFSELERWEAPRDPTGRCSSSSRARRTRRTGRQGGDPAWSTSRASRRRRPRRLRRGLRHALARPLVPGVDVWLNTPRRPMEASGTCGMKAAINGVLNCSILDGWWAEACRPGSAGRSATSVRATRRADLAERGALRDARAGGAADVLRAGRAQPADALDRDDAPTWIAELGTQFSTNRMVTEYVEELYLPAHGPKAVEVGYALFHGDP